MKILDRYIDQLIEQSTPESPVWNIEKIREGSKSTWNYIDGCMIKAIIELFLITRNHRYLDFADAFTALHERPVEEGTQLGRIPVANIIVFETGAGDVVRHIIGDIVVVHRFRIVIFRTPVHIGDISDLPVADVERTVRGKRNLLVGNGLECIDPPTLVDLPGESGCLFRRMISQMGRKKSRQASLSEESG